MKGFGLFLLTLLASVLAVPVCAAVGDKVEETQVKEALARLDKELGVRDEYLRIRREPIDSMRSVLADKKLEPLRRLPVLLELGDAYNALNTDSAIHFYIQGLRLAEELGLDSVAARFRLREATFLPLLAFQTQAAETFGRINPETLPKGLLAEYYDASRQMNSYIAAYYSGYPEIHAKYMALAKDAQEKLLPLLDDESPRHMLNQGEYFLYRGEYSKAKTLLLLLLDRVPEENNLYARACKLLADIAKARGEHHAHLYYLASSAIADTRGATLEVASLQELGRMMYLNGDISRAYRYLSIALAGAVECNAPLRILQSAEAFPIIDNAYKAEMEASNVRLIIIMIVLAIMLLAVGVTLWFLHRKNRQIGRMASRLEDANLTKDVYIKQFLNLCSIYMDKLSQFNKMVNRKISTGKVDDLFKITKSGRFIEEQSKEFYDVFDDAFLHIYPNFVAEVNALLRPEEQIILPEGEKLNTDLRIIAFMRLGIEESARIAQMLNYSVYTIYTYRNKLKNRAINRDTFEAQVMKLKSLS